MADTQKEIEQLQKLIKQFQGIIATSRNPEQVARAKKEYKILNDRLLALAPDRINESLIKPIIRGGKKSLNEHLKDYYHLADYFIQPLSKYCNDDEINFSGFALLVWEENFQRMLNSQIKIEYSLVSERESHFTLLEKQKRALNDLLHICEVSATAIKEESRQQFRDMKSRNTRQFLQDTSLFFKKMRDFWTELYMDIEARGVRCLNPDDEIDYQALFGDPQLFKGKSARAAVKAALGYLNDVIEFLNVPEIKNSGDKPLMLK